MTQRFEPDRTQPADLERHLLMDAVEWARVHGFNDLEDHLLDQDSELFNVSLDDGTEWRDAE